MNKHFMNLNLKYSSVIFSRYFDDANSCMHCVFVTRLGTAKCVVDTSPRPRSFLSPIITILLFMVLSYGQFNVLTRLLVTRLRTAKCVVDTSPRPRNFLSPIIAILLFMVLSYGQFNVLTRLLDF